MAVRPVPESLWTEWSHALNQANMAGGNQETVLEEIYDQMERELMVLSGSYYKDNMAKVDSREQKDIIRGI